MSPTAMGYIFLIGCVIGGCIAFVQDIIRIAKEQDET